MADQQVPTVNVTPPPNLPSASNSPSPSAAAGSSLSQMASLGKMKQNAGSTPASQSSDSGSTAASDSVGGKAKPKLRPSKVPGKKAGPNGSFPVGDPKHARLAIGGATRSFNAAHISKGTEERIKAEARHELDKGGKAKPKPKPKKRKPEPPREFSAGQRSFGNRSWGQFSQGPRVQQAPGLGGGQQPDDEAPPDIGA